MLSSTRSRVRALAAVGMAGVAVAIGGVAFDASAATAPADTRAVAIPAIPDAIKPPAGSRPVGAWVVTNGTQTYTCVVPAGATAGAYTGASVPEAKLAGTGGKMHHFAGPSWQALRDGSLVTAVREASSPRDGTIAELLLRVDSRTGKGILTRSDFINRLYTSGGVAPAGACAAGDTVSVPYGAVYVFWDAPAT